MQVWNVLHAARWKCRTQKIAKNSPSGHHRINLSGYIFATKAYIDSLKKIAKQQCLPHMWLQYGELRLTSRWDLLASLGHPSKFQRLSRLGSVTARHSSSGRQPKFAALNRGRHLHSAGWPSRWALAHILVLLSSRNLSGRRVDVYNTSTIYTWCGLSANLECRSEMCCTGLAGITGRKYDATRM